MNETFSFDDVSSEQNYKKRRHAILTKYQDYITQRIDDLSETIDAVRADLQRLSEERFHWVGRQVYTP